MKPFIKHNAYPTGVQSLGFSIRHLDQTVGVVPPGDHEFGPLTRSEHLKVIAGSLNLSWPTGEQRVITPSDAPIVFSPGDMIRLSTEEGAAYLCTYID